MPSLVCPRRAFFLVGGSTVDGAGVLAADCFVAVRLVGAACFAAVAFFAAGGRGSASSRVAFAAFLAVVAVADRVGRLAAVWVVAFRPDGDVLVDFFVVAMRREPPRRRDRTGQYSWRTERNPGIDAPTLPRWATTAPTGNHERQTVVIRPTVDMVDPDATTTRRRLPSLPRPTHALVAAVTLVAVVGGAVFVASTRSSLVAGIVDGQRITRRDLATVTAAASPAPEQARVMWASRSTARPSP